jgi:hypothetical protein
MSSSLKSRIGAVLAGAVLVAAVAAGSVAAGPGLLDDPFGLVIGVSATSQAGSGSTFFLPELVFDPDAGWGTWSLAQPVAIYSSENPNLALGIIESLTTAINPDPVIGFTFNVKALDVDTIFNISSVTLSFPGIAFPDAVASAGITITDTNGDGAYLVGGYVSNTLAYQAQTNLGVYAHLVPNITALPNQSATASQTFPVMGFNTIPGTVTSMQTSFTFLLSAHDAASGSSVFYVGPPIPEPASMTLAALGLAGIAGLRRKARA